MQEVHELFGAFKWRSHAQSGSTQQVIESAREENNTPG